MLDSSDVERVLTKAKTDCYNNTNISTIGGNFCQLIFDDLMCWPPTAAGELARQPCSNDYIKSNKTGFATKQCDANGNWLINLQNSTRSWTNYSQCGGFYIQEFKDDTIYEKWIPVIHNITFLGYIMSIISLLIAIFIFVHIKRLHCARNKLHIHLFASFILRALTCLIKDGLLVYSNVFQTNSWFCKSLISLWNYFIISNYMFLLVEAVYLHNLLFLKLFAENRIVIYYAAAWGFPIFFVVPWIILKTQNENINCWTTKANENIALIIGVPIATTVIINFILFLVIVRTLFVKLSSMYQQRRTKYQKLMRAILILVPLFGIPFAVSFVLSFYVTQNQTFEILWLFFDQTFTAFQGLFASLVYCLMNNEVQVEVVRKYRSFKDCNAKEFKRRSRTISHTTQIALNEEMQDLGIKASEYF